jgi:uncharacterized SAM-binding protein YcdF (DUF218 family)
MGWVEEESKLSIERFNFSVMRGKNVAITSVSILIVLGLLLYIFRCQLLTLAGTFLEVKQAPENADLIVILRGGSNFARLVTAFRLYESGYADKIYISKSLGDNNTGWSIEKLGIHLPTGQEQMEYVLRELGVSATNIILGHEKPGGGTLGESIRIKKIVKALNVKKMILVTSWYHTRRVRLIYSNVFSNTGVQPIIIAAKKEYSKSSPLNWWKCRYQAMAVLEEFGKLLLAYLGVDSKLSFSDDPNVKG